MLATISVTDEQLNLLINGGELRLMCPMELWQRLPYGQQSTLRNQQLRLSIHSKDSMNSSTALDNLNLSLSRLARVSENLSSLERSCSASLRQHLGTLEECSSKNQYENC